MIALALALLAASPSSLDCIGASRQRSDLAGRIGALLSREAERGSANRAEIGAVRTMTRRREWLLACPPEKDM